MSAGSPASSTAYSRTRSCIRQRPGTRWCSSDSCSSAWTAGPGRSLSRAAAAGALISGPAATPSRANARRCGPVRAATVVASTVRRPATASPSRALSRVAASRSSAATAARPRCGCCPARAAAMPRASGNPAHAVTTASAVPGSRPIVESSSRRRSSSCAAASSRTASGTAVAACAAISPVNRSRLVTSTAPAPVPGSSGATCALSRALSSTISTRRSATRLRYRPTGASGPLGRARWGTPRASRRLRTTPPGGSGVVVGSKPRSSANSCPSGNASRCRCARCVASHVLPTPPGPVITATRAASPPGIRASRSPPPTGARHPPPPAGRGRLRRCRPRSRRAPTRRSR